MITFGEENNNSVMFQDYFDIYVGLVSGKEEVYKNEELGNINIINGKDKIDKYIYIEKYPCEIEENNKYLLHHKKKNSVIWTKLAIFGLRNLLQYYSNHNNSSYFQS